MERKSSRVVVLVLTGQDHQMRRTAKKPAGRRVK